MSASEAKQFVEGLPARSNNASMFYPWIEVPDPVGVGRNPRRYVPPSGHMAGVFARTDNSRGVWKAPAGIEATVSADGIDPDPLDNTASEPTTYVSSRLCSGDPTV